MDFKKILWLEDQYEDFSAYRSELFRNGYYVDAVRTISDTLIKLKSGEYIAFICDIKVLPGDDPQWMELDQSKRKERTNFDSYLGLELLETLFSSGLEKLKSLSHIRFNVKNVIVLSVVYDKSDELEALGIPPDQIQYKSVSSPTSLLRLIQKIEKRQLKDQENTNNWK